jgi:hypothetical protein
MSSTPSVIQLSPASAAFVNARRTTLGPWVLGGFLDCILMGVILCQTTTFFLTARPATGALQRYYRYMVIFLTFLSSLKTLQIVVIVWHQNVLEFANPDVARTLMSKAWWQVSVPLMTGVTGCIVQSFFCLRFYLLSRKWVFCVPIVAAMCLGLGAVCLSTEKILSGSNSKVTWLTVHLVGVFVADLLITTGTIHELRKRRSGHERTARIVHRLLILVMESAFPPTVVAMLDLIMTQMLGSQLLWHIFANMALGKLYVISMLYTLNSINEYHIQDSGSREAYSYRNGGRSGRSRAHNTNLELGDQNVMSKVDEISIETHVSRHVTSASAPTCLPTYMETTDTPYRVAGDSAPDRIYYLH